MKKKAKKTNNAKKAAGAKRSPAGIKDEHYKKINRKLRLYSRLMSFSIIVFIACLILHNVFSSRHGEFSFFSSFFFFLFFIAVVATIVFLGLILYVSLWKIDR